MFSNGTYIRRSFLLHTLGCLKRSQTMFTTLTSTQNTVSNCYKKNGKLTPSMPTLETEIDILSEDYKAKGLFRTVQEWSCAVNQSVYSCISIDIYTSQNVAHLPLNTHLVVCSWLLAAHSSAHRLSLKTKHRLYLLFTFQNKY